MLTETDKKKLENYIDKTLNEVRSGAERSIQNHLPNQQVIEQVASATANKMSGVSKMMITSIYNMLSEKTLSGELYQKIENEAAFRRLNILNDLNKKFSFEVPAKIDYTESQTQLEPLIAAGAVTVAGGVISIAASSLTPIGVSIVIAAIMYYTINSKKQEQNTFNINSVIETYLKNVKLSMMQWIGTIETYYDQRVMELEQGLKK